jgi:DNA-binding NarL/FixJ family response regulator
MFREGLRATLARRDGIEVVGSVDTVVELRELLAAEPPDVILLDLTLADGNGLTIAGELATLAPDVRVLVLTSADDHPTIHSALRVGAHGFLHKTATPAEIVSAVLTVAAGDGVFDAAALKRIQAQFTTGARAAGPFPQLTPREHEVLDLMARGLSNAAIADHFVLSLKAVRNQVSSIFAKLGVARREEAIVLARDHGMGV